jgi:putative methylase
VRRSELIRRIDAIRAPPAPRPDLEQVVTPAEAAADLLFAAVAHGDLEQRTVLDLGTGTGRLAIGAALLGASSVVGLDVDPEVLRIARDAAGAQGVKVDFVESTPGLYGQRADTVIMNPPFGAQRKRADRPFWDAAFRLAHRSVYGFALADSRSFIPRRAVAAGVHVLETRPVAWELPRTFPHHTQRRVELSVDLWALRTEHAP